ncbi:hypothetical protein [Fontibacter flavus]|uniref:Uncharacterized protein n=1 Tax=Fontibacter flavus TaxID=654838 RepID=A0ABV6FW76_9BACT
MAPTPVLAIVGGGIYPNGQVMIKKDASKLLEVRPVLTLSFYSANFITSLLNAPF